MTPKFHVIARLGSYTDKATGKRIHRYATCGMVFESPNGRLFMRLDALPVSPEWSGFISFRDASPGAPAPEEPECTEDQTGPIENHATLPS